MTGTHKQWLTVEQIGKAIDEISALAMKQGTSVALAGGLAMQLHGSDRLTKDVDFLSGDLLRGLKVIKPLTFGGVSAVTKAGTPVDLIVRDDDYEPMYEDALLSASVTGDIPVRVVGAEFMAALKLAAGRDKDLFDLRFLLTNIKKFDYGHARSIVLKYMGLYAADELDAYQEEFKWLEKRDEAKKTGHRPRKSRRRT